MNRNAWFRARHLACMCCFALMSAEIARGGCAASNVLYKAGGALSDYERERCRLDVHAPDGPTGFPVLVWFHGGGLTAGGKSEAESTNVIAGFTRSGVGVVVPNYRLSPKAVFPSYVEDAAAAVAWTRDHIAEHGGDPGRVFIGGHSAGGYLALMLGLDPRYLKAAGVALTDIAGLVPVSGQVMTHYTVVKERGLDRFQITADEAAPVHFARKDTPPLLVLYADGDLPARAEENAYLVAILKAAGHKQVTGRVIADRNHANIAGRMSDENDAGLAAAVSFIRAPDASR